MKINWTQPALYAAQDIKSFIEKDSPLYAEKFILKLIKRIELLRLHPDSGTHIPGYEKKNIRQIIVGNYRVIYQHSDAGVLILHIVHGKRDFDFSNED